MSSPATPLRHRVPRAAEAAVARARLTVVPRTRRRAAKVPFVTLVTLILVGGVVGLLLFNTSMQQASFAATALQQRAEALTAREQILRLQLDELRDPQRVAREAQEMGMVPATNPAFLHLGTNEVLGNPEPATVEDRMRITPTPPPKPAVLTPEPLVVEVIAPRRAREGSGGEAREGSRRDTRQGSDGRERPTGRN